MKTSYSDTLPNSIPDARIAIIQANWHKEHTNRMVEASIKILRAAQCSVPEIFIAPGCYEIPLTAKLLAKQKTFEAIIVYGVILKGETDHYEVILQTCIRELGRVMYEHEVPIIMGILPVHDMSQVIARSQGDHNKGIEAALATVDVVALHRKIRSGKE